MRVDALAAQACGPQDTTVAGLPVRDEANTSIVLKMKEEIKEETFQNRACGCNQLPPTLKQKPNQSLRYRTASALEQNQTTDTQSKYHKT
ncbi:hypothetical protein [Marivita sp.]|uniref:hypothetical protein n=1 Tax=Marivita sp. TaxID=2003365 RepID=UPI00321BCDCA